MIKHSFINLLNVPRLTRRLPFMSIESKKTGPTVFLTACIHGDEVGGTAVIQEIFKIAEKNILKGKIYAFPLLNPAGFKNLSRYINLKKEDLNRSFPGGKDGSLSGRIAYQIFNTILEKKPDLVLDLHNDWRKSIPFNLIDYDRKVIKTDAYKKAKEISRQSGLLTVLDDDEIKRTLSYNLIKKRIPAITMELGEAYIINEENVKIGVGAIMNVLKKMGMLKSIGKTFIYPLAKIPSGKILRYSEQSSSAAGIIRFYIKPGERVKNNQTVAKIYDAFGKLKKTMKSSVKGVVLGHADYSAISRGIEVISFGRLK